MRGKTGTTNDRRDAWFVGYTRQWLGVVWTGRDDNAPAGVTGSATAMPIWAEIFNRLPSSEQATQWPESLLPFVLPSNIQTLSLFCTLAVSAFA